MHREDGREDSEHADQQQRIDEEEVSGGVRHAASEAEALPLRVDERHDQRKEAQEEIDDVTRSSFSEHQRSVQPYDGDRHNQEVVDASRLIPKRNVLRQVSDGYGNQK